MRVLVYDDRFAIDENGTLSTRSKFPTSEIGRSITLRLVASFEQFYASNDEINATIEVTGANLHPPKFAQKKYVKILALFLCKFSLMRKIFAFYETDFEFSLFILHIFKSSLA